MFERPNINVTIILKFRAFALNLSVRIVTFLHLFLSSILCDVKTSLNKMNDAESCFTIFAFEINSTFLLLQNNLNNI